MTAIVLRSAVESDEDFLAALHHAVRGEAFAALPLPAPQIAQLARGQYLAERDSYRRSFGESGHAIVLDGAVPIGRVWVHRTALEVRLVDILLLPEFQGRGIGSELIGRLQAEAPPRPVTLHVAVNNGAAARLYARLGFAAEGQTGMHIAMRWIQATKI